MRKLLFLLSLIAILSGLFLRLSYAFVMAIPPLWLLLFSYISFPKLIDVSINRQISDRRILDSSIVDISLTIKNNGSTLHNVFIEDVVPKGLTAIGSNQKRFSIKRGETFKLDYQISGKRGKYDFERTRLEIEDIFSIYKEIKFLTTEGKLTVTSNLSGLRGIKPQPRRTLVYAGMNPAHIGGQGNYFFDIREYQQGDAIQHVNWKLSARYPEKLFINEFEQERVADIGFIVDIREKAYLGTEALLESTLHAAGALSENFLLQSNRAGLLMYGKSLDFVFPGYGKKQVEAIRNALGEGSLGTHTAFKKLENLPLQLFPSRSQIVFVSPLLAEDTAFLKRLRSRGYALLIISPNPVLALPYDKTNKIAKEARRLAILERELIIRNLRRSGVYVVDWDTTVSFESQILKEQAFLQIWNRKRHL